MLLQIWKQFPCFLVSRTENFAKEGKRQTSLSHALHCQNWVIWVVTTVQRVNREMLCVTSAKPPWALRVTQVQLLVLCVRTELPGHATITSSHGNYASSGTSVHTWNSWVTGVMLPSQCWSWAVILRHRIRLVCLGFSFFWVWVVLGRSISLFAFLVFWCALTIVQVISPTDPKPVE